jgi:phosphate-selective porin OprO and OprP
MRRTGIHKYCTVLLRAVLLSSILVAIGTSTLSAQTHTNANVVAVPAPASAMPTIWARLGSGINVMANDSSFSLRFRVRVQTLFQSRVQTESWSNGNAEAGIQRLRLRFEGFLFSPTLLYKVQFNASNRDMESQRNPQTDNPGILRDAVVQWQFAKGWQIDIGQSKLPGNRQRVISSQRQEFVDRSHANAIFNIDRDIGITLRNDVALGSMLLKNALAITNGEGRNRIATPGNAITGRTEIQPLGEFHNDGDESEGDVYREPSPRCALGLVYSTNTRATRIGGQIGVDMFGETTINTFIADWLWKYRGWSVSAEYFRRFSQRPISINPNSADDIRSVYNGMGFNVQSTYIFPSMFQLGARYTLVTPAPEVSHLFGERYDMMLCAGQYFSGHDLKIIGDVGYIVQSAPQINTATKTLQVRLQVEFAL